MHHVHRSTQQLRSVVSFFKWHFQEEQEVVIKGKEERGEERPLTWADTKKMTYTTRVILETLRVASILSFTFREAVQDVEYEGTYFISPLTRVFPVSLSKTFRSNILCLWSQGIWSQRDGRCYHCSGIFTTTLITSLSLTSLTLQDLR